MKKIVAFVYALLCCLSATLHAQELSVTVTPTMPVLPPQAALYLEDPGRFFTVTITNMSDETANIFVGIELEQTSPGSITLTTPTNYQPQVPVSVYPGSTLTLTRYEMKTLFRQVPLSEIVMTGGSLNDFTDGTVGLLPEGHYIGHFVTYRWDPAQHTPEALSNPTQGNCQFDICYNAPAPVITMPVENFMADQLEDIFAGNTEVYNATTVNFSDPVTLAWTPTTNSCATTAPQVRYDVEFFKLQNNLSPEEAVTYTKQLVHHIDNVTSTTALINMDLPTRKMKFVEGEYYVMRVKAKTTANDASQANYMHIENDGYSPLRVLKVTYKGDKNGDETGVNADEKKEDPAKTDSVNADTITYYMVPELVHPVSKDYGVWTANRINADTMIVAEWKAPVYSKGPKETEHKFTYNVGIYKIAEGEMQLDSIAATKPVFEHAQLHDTMRIDTIKWDAIKEKVTKGQEYMLIVTAKPTTDSLHVKFLPHGTDCYRMVYYDESWKDNQLDCNPDAAKTIEDKEAVELALDDDKKQVKIGAFDLFITKLEEGGSASSGYNGEGYIVWRPYGSDLKFAVTFQKLKVNKENVVFVGEAKSKTEGELSQYCNLFSEVGTVCDESFGNKWSSSITNQYPALEKELKSSLGGYYKYVHGSGGYANTAYNLIASGFDSYESTSPMMLPLGLPEEMCPSLPLDISMTNMVFSPTTAYLTLIAMFKLPGSDVNPDQVLAFGCPRLCITPDSPWAETGTFGLLYDLELDDPDSKFKFKFNAPSDWETLNDGTFVTWQNSKFSEMGIDVSCNVPGLKKDVGNGKVEGTPSITMRAQIKDWDDWMAQVKMDPFQLEEAEGFTIAPGENIVYDHSNRKNADGFKLPIGYKLRDSGFTRENQWQGLFIQRTQLKFPAVLSFTDAEPVDDEKGEKGDASKAAKASDGRLALSFDNFLLDVAPKGVFASFDVSLDKVFSAETTRMGGWGISLDKIYLSMLQNNFKDAGFWGDLKVPLLDGSIRYGAIIQHTSINHEEVEMIFKTQQAKDLKLDFFLGQADFLQKGTYFTARHNFTQEKTDVELMASGIVSILSDHKASSDSDAKKPGLDFNLPEISFVGMRLGNHRYAEAHKTDWLGEGLEKAMKEFKDSKSNTALKDDKGFLIADNGSDTQNKIDETIIAKEHDLFEGESTDDHLYFSIGNWSMASPEKGLWGTPFVLNDIGIVTRKDHGYGLKFDGGVTIMGEEENGVSGTVGFTIWTQIENLSFSTISDIKVKYKETKFEKLRLDGSLAGGSLTMHGALTVFDEESKAQESRLGKSGFDAEFELGVKSLFSFGVAGAYYKVDKSAEDKKLDQPSDTTSTYKAGYFAGRLDTEQGITVGPVTLKGVNGGFLYNMGIPSGTVMETADMYEVIKEHKELRYKSYGGAFGLKMTCGDETLVKANLGLLVLYDAGADRLSNLHLTGTVDALNPGTEEGSEGDGLVHAKCDIIYEDTRTATNSDEEDAVQSFTINITADSEADMSTLYKKFTGDDYKLPEAVTHGLEAFSSDTADDKGEENKDNDNAEKNSEKKGYISASVDAKISLEFQFRHYPNKAKDNKKWHLYLGKPTPETERCRITFIDFALGKDSPVGIWAKCYANAYLCLGNELPDGGALPPVPAKVEEALGGIGGDGKSHKSEYMKKLQDAQNEVIKNGVKGNIDGGIQFGAALGAEIGCNAVFCYASVEAMLGFDVVLKKYAEGCLCTDGSPLGGKNGFYAEGQIYAMMKGEMGLMVDLWIFKGKIPLVDMEMGAMLKGGLPNPSWAYGKVRAKGEILKGLIKFNSSIEMKVGRICVPAKGNPLDDIEIFGDYAFGNEKRTDGWAEANAVSPDPQFTFTTNMGMGQYLELIDESRFQNEAGMETDEDKLEKYLQDAKRTYVFYFGTEQQGKQPQFDVKRYYDDSEDGRAYANGNKGSFTAAPVQTSADMTGWKLNLGSLEPESFYKIILTGYCKEVLGGNLVDPVFSDSQGRNYNKAWSQTKELYFCTGKLSENVWDDVVMVIPQGKEVYNTAADIRRPQLVMRRSRADMWNNADYEYCGDIQRQITRSVGGARYKYSQYPDIQYSAFKTNLGQTTRLAGQVSRFENIKMAEVIERSNDYNSEKFEYVTFMSTELLPELNANGDYIFSLMRIRKGEMQNYLDQIEEKFKSMIQSEDGQAITQEETIEGAEADMASGIAREMAAIYKQLEGELGPNEAEQRFMEYRQQVHDQARQQFSDVVGTSSFHYNGCQDFRAFIQQNFSTMLDSYFDFSAEQKKHLSDMNIDQRDPIHWQVYDYLHTAGWQAPVSQSAYAAYYDPYESLMWWNRAMGSGRAGWMPKWALSGQEIPNVQKMTYNSTNYYVLASSQYREMGTDIPVDDDFAQRLSFVNRDRWNSNSSGHLRTGITRIVSGIAQDAKIAASVDSLLRVQWYGINQNLTMAQLVNLPANSNVYSKMQTWVNNHVKSVTSYQAVKWPSYQLAMLYGAEDQNKYYQDSKMWLAQSYFGHGPIGAIDKLDNLKNGGYRSFTRSFSTRAGSQSVTMSYGIFDRNKYWREFEGLSLRMRRVNGYNSYNGCTGDVMNVRPSTSTDNMCQVNFRLSADDKHDAWYKRADELNTQTWKWELDIDNYDVVTADTVYIADPCFRKYLLETMDYDSNHDGRLQRSEANSITELVMQNLPSIDGIGLHDLTGIESMANLQNLDIRFEPWLHQVNLTANLKLKSVHLQLASLESLVLGSCPDLTTLYVGPWDISVSTKADRKGIRLLDLKGCPNLVSLNVSHNNIVYLDVTQCPKLTSLICWDNQLSLLDLRHNPLLKYTLNTLSIGRQMRQMNDYTLIPDLRLHLYAYPTISLSELKALGFTSYVGSINNTTPVTATSTDQLARNANVFYNGTSNAQDNMKLDLDPVIYEYLLQKYPYTTSYGVTQVDIEKVRNVTTLDVDDMGVKSLRNVGKWMPKLEVISCRRNQIDVIDLSDLIQLRYLYCSDNRISKITTSANSKLLALDCSRNIISGFSCEHHPQLTELLCADNNMVALLLAGSKSLLTLDCSGNKLEVIDLTDCSGTIETLRCSGNKNMSKMVGYASCSHLHEFRCADNDYLNFLVNEYCTGLSRVDISRSRLRIQLGKNTGSIVELRANGAVVKYAGSPIMLSSNTILPVIQYLDLSDVEPSTECSSTWLYIKGRSQLRYLNTAHSFVRHITLEDVPALDTLKMGRPYVNDGKMNLLSLNYVNGSSTEVYNRYRDLCAKWPAWEGDPDNYLAYCEGKSSGTRNYDSRDSEDNIKAMRDALGVVLYERAKNRFAPDAPYFTPTMALDVDSLDCSGCDLSSLSAVSTYFPNLRWLNCSKNFIRKIVVNLPELRYMDASDNEELYSVEMRYPYHMEYYNFSNTSLREWKNPCLDERCVVDLSGVKTDAAVKDLLSNNYRMLKLIVRNTTALNGHLTISNLNLKALDLSGSPVTGISISSNKLQSINLSDSKVALSSIQSLIAADVDSIIAKKCTNVSGSLEILDQHRVRYLVLSDTKLSSLRVNNTYMTHLDVSRSGLTAITELWATNLKYLDFSSCHLFNASIVIDDNITELRCGNQKSTKPLRGTTRNYNATINLNVRTMSDYMFNIRWNNRWKNLPENVRVNLTVEEL